MRFFAQFLQRVPGLIRQGLPIALLRVGDDVAFTHGRLQLSDQFLQLFEVPLKVQGISRDLRSFVQGLIACASVITDPTKQYLWMTAHQHNAHRTTFTNRREHITRPGKRLFEAGRLSVPHAVGGVDTNHDTHVTGSTGITASVEQGSKQCQGDEQKGQASQEQEQSIFHADLLGSLDHRLLEQLHGRPVDFDLLPSAPEMDQDRQGHAKRCQAAP